MAKRKLLLAHVRDGNYAHAGEEEAIEIAMKLIPKNEKQLLLDVGCGLGGTASYLEKNGWGKVSGIDVDPKMIQQAKESYPDLDFNTVDVLKMIDCFKNIKFDVIFSFNAFFCFPNQEESLKAMRNVASNTGKLILFDYSSDDDFTKDNLFIDRHAKTVKIFSPINMKKIEPLLSKTGWELKKMIGLTNKFEEWYESLLSKMDAQKKLLTDRYGEDTFEDLHEGYSQLLALIKSGKIGGTVIYAEARKNNS